MRSGVAARCRSTAATRCAPGTVIAGPALIEEAASVTVVEPASGWVDAFGHLMIDAAELRGLRTMRFSENGFYIEKYLKCANCGLLIYGDGHQAPGAAASTGLYCSDWCVEWAR